MKKEKIAYMFIGGGVTALMGGIYMQNVTEKNIPNPLKSDKSKSIMGLGALGIIVGIILLKAN